MSKDQPRAMEKDRPQNGVPEVRGMPFLGVLPEFMKNPLELALKAQKLGGFVRLPMGRYQVYLLSEPELIKHVLEDRIDIYTRESFTRDIVSVFSGRSTFTSDGAEWRRKRSMLEPAFDHERIAGFAEIITKATAAMLQRWEVKAYQGTAFDAFAEVKKLASEIVCRLSLGSKLSQDEIETLTNCIDTAQDWIDSHRKNLVSLPLSIPTPRNRGIRRAMQTFDSLVYRAIDEHRRQDKTSGSLIGLMLQMADASTGEAPTDLDIRDEIAQGLSGYHQIAYALAWTIYCLAQYEAHAQKIHSENISVLAGRVPSAQDFNQLSYTRMFVDETLRLYPVNWAIVRQAAQDDVIAGYPVSAKSFVFPNCYSLHRDARFWNQPESFDPERFSPDRRQSIPPFAFLPLSGGPRRCLGYHIALLTLPLVTAMIGQTFQVRLATDHPPLEVEIALVLIRPKNGLFVTLQKLPAQASGV